MNVIGPLKVIIAGDTDGASTFEGRVYPVRAPNAPGFPYTVGTVNGVAPAQNKTTVSLVDNVVVEFQTISNVFEEACIADEVLRRAVDRFRGFVSLPSGAVSKIDGIRFETFRYDIDGQEGDLFYVISQYVVRVQRDTSVPEYGMTPYYDDAAAAAGGVAVGDYYLLDDPNGYFYPGLIIKQRAD